MRLSLIAGLAACCLGLPAWAQTQPDTSELTRGEETVEQATGPKNSRGYFVTKLTQAGTPSPNFNKGKALYFYTTLGKNANRYTYGSAMTPGRTIALVGTPAITTIGIQSDGRYTGNYSGIWLTEMQDATGFSGGRDLTFGPLVDQKFFETYMVGDVAFKVAEDTFSSALAVKWRPHPDPTDAHAFGEDGTALIFPQQLAPELDDLKALKMLTTSNGNLRVLAHATDKQANGDDAHSLWMIGVTTRGVLDRSFGDNGAVKLPMKIGPFWSTYAYRPHFYDANRSPNRFFVGQITRKAARAHIEIDGFDADTGLRIADFSPIDLRIDHGTPNAFRLAMTDQRIVVVANIPGTETFQKPKRLIAMFDLFGRPNPNFSGDGKRLVELENPNLLLEAAALTRSNILYIVESLKFETHRAGAVSKWLVDDISQGKRDRTWGQLQPFVSLDSQTTRSQAGEDMSAFNMNLYFADAFIEPLGNVGHTLVITGAGDVR